jgi:hypothetical protein
MRTFPALPGLRGGRDINGESDLRSLCACIQAFVLGDANVGTSRLTAAMPHAYLAASWQRSSRRLLSSDKIKVTAVDETSQRSCHFSRPGGSSRCAWLWARGRVSRREADSARAGCWGEAGREHTGAQDQGGRTHHIYSI